MKDGRLPSVCPDCGVRVRASHPFLLGVLLGFGASILVSTIEILTLGYFINADATIVFLILFASIPSVFLLSAGFGVVVLKRLYGNIVGLDRIVLGTVPVFVVFFFLWSVFLIILAVVLGCVSSSC